ncbi:hypothetical protein [Roseofilum casamattae]|uniref:Response regulator n=1 Tax=Roseofilum casamattae BLCC-M143 TaxID=3022442 RepID=A0ABT7BWB9_9CYAN|nr:hypothetical protein [Roseofilum casamattae]MDJ1183475.1 hypothetical protein [Roseofilum casamattae BLCC-M143]
MKIQIIDRVLSLDTPNLVLASARFAPICVSKLVDLEPAQTVVCRKTQELLHRLRHQTIELLILDILFLEYQTQRFCWRLQELYPELQIIVLGRTEEELAGCNWVYEYPNVSTACLPGDRILSTDPQTSEFAMNTDSQILNSPSSTLSAIETYLESVVGAAVFDLSGLPREYLITDEVDNVGWVQTVFQALGLRSLLMSSLQLDTFHYASTCADGYRAIVIKQKEQYIALLLKPENFYCVTQDLIAWAQSFNPDELKLYPQFRIA